MKKASSNSKQKQILKDRTKLERVLFIALILIAYLLLASRFAWWPLDPNTEKLGSAFYIVKQRDIDRVLSQAGSGGSNNSGIGSGNSGGSANGSGNGGNGGGSSSGSSLLNFAATVDTGSTKQDISGHANGIDQNCAVLLNASALGKQEVCTYREGDKLVTVTYLNDRVISASRSGF